MAIFVPPAIFDEEQTVLDLPMGASSRQQLGGSDKPRIQARKKITCLGQQYGAVVGNYVPINTQANLRPGKCQRFTKVLRVVQIEPQLTAVDNITFFSTL